MNPYDGTPLVKSRAVELNGQAVTLALVGGQTLTGTLAYVAKTGAYGSVDYPHVLTLTTSGKATTVRVDHVSAIGQG
ncbi:hypothetical protein C0Q57_30780 [Streptomyces albidoflavus]|uniref:hypothetical protein n=1 Tax=Streptomyces albidoflavus TaxID=1886 RepID=UPI001020F8EC|nr:hypothetical protein [Streptomyces albidoflavus]RZD56325.1 hypothetical protein C0Q57_30780 [Streptomyces albidoflavus]